MLFVFRSIALVRNLFVVAKKSISLKALLLHLKPKHAQVSEKKLGQTILLRFTQEQKNIQT